jgi:tRNA(fMet)-specific endonuclease VapC
MSGRFLLDTNTVIALFARDASVESHLEAADEVLLPTITLGELYYGARKSSRPDANAARIDELASVTPVLACDASTARRYGDIKNQLRAQARPIPENDVWIAAIALQHDLVLATRDEHFAAVEGLAYKRW